MPPSDPAIERLMKALRLDTPLIAVYDSPPDDHFEPIVRAKGRICCFAYYKQWLEGKTVLFEKDDGSFDSPKHGCYGAQLAFGLRDGYPPYMAHFLTDGKGAPMGEGLKATPELAQEFLDRVKPPELSGDSVLVGPLKTSKWKAVRSVTFLVDPDRLAGLMTLAAYWSSDPDFIHAPFSSGCGMMLRDLESQERERALIGCTDIAMRKYIPADILSITVTPKHFERMVGYPVEAFLKKDWWNDLMKSRKK